jgi:transcriptional regulator with XRE-family HTH domain
MAGLSKDLVKQRKDLKLTQEDVALALGVSRVTYNNWEQNISTMPVGRYEQVLRLFDNLRAKRKELKGE